MPPLVHAVADPKGCTRILCTGPLFGIRRNMPPQSIQLSRHKTGTVSVRLPFQRLPVVDVSVDGVGVRRFQYEPFGSADLAVFSASV